MTRKIKSQKTSFKKLSLRLSNRQINSLYNYCEINKVTPNKLIKALLKTYVEDYTDEKIGREEADKRQLKLFTPVKPEDYEQLTIFSNNKL